MVINIKNCGENLISIMRRIGYIENRYGSDINFFRPLSALNYPRFHIYPQRIEGGFLLKLHLDAKKPIYKGVSAHSGEYEGKVIEDEKKRICKLLDIS